MGQVNDDEFSALLLSGVTPGTLNDMRHRSDSPLSYVPDDTIFYSSLTSPESIITPEVGSVTTPLEVGTGTTFDRTKGMNPGSAGGYRLFQINNHASLDTEFHIQFEIEKDFLCFNDPTNGSSGLVPGTTVHPFTMQAVVGGALALMQKTVGGALQCWIDSTIYDNRYRDWTLTVDSVNALIQSAGKNEFVTVNVWGDASIIALAIDKTIIAAGGRTPTQSGIFNDIYLGSDRGSAGFIGDFFMRNLLIRNKVPVLTTNPLLSMVGILSDSLFNTDIESSVYRDTMTSHVIRQQLAKLGWRADAFYVDINSGFTAFTTGSNDISSRVSALLAQSPVIVPISMGTNDIIGGVPINDAWDADVKLNVLDPIIADATVQHILPGTITSLIGDTSNNTAANREKIRIANNYIKSWEQYSPKIKVVDRYNALYGEFPEADTYIGQLNTLFNDLHYAGIGLNKVGRAHGSILEDILGKSGVVF